ncbi:ATP-dependent nuclease [Pseudoalteromonas spongiae]|uniref:ATP-dependent nuclease n=1 Tax=Pseudoalteromonas spongiae TaxID=298657 RepID=UPI00110A5C18|nr:AAA family ATPase [Pseudoalteromonas spongiae]TMO86586.1 ATP-dependent endonuclease [Pseudoalteromonas spongiae]
MKIAYIDIQNFRKLKSCRLALTDKETVFVGANNSGKTSALDALIKFLNHNSNSGSRKILAHDFTISNWVKLNEIALSWLEDENEETISDWYQLCPSIDIWIDATAEDVHKVRHLIPTLKWKGGYLGVRLIFCPKNLDDLKESYLFEYNAAQDTVKAHNRTIENDQNHLQLWPKNLREYLNRKLSSHFEIKAFLLDTELFKKSLTPQDIPRESESLDSYPFTGLFRVDVIEAQRGFYDPSAENASKATGLSTQLNEYYNKHLNPTDLPDENDLSALEAIDTAKRTFDSRLNESFEDALGEVRRLGYPGFNDPDIQLSSLLNPVDGLDHDSAVVFNVQGNDEAMLDMALPERYNGLGYKNLIHMIFKLISFRDAWLRVGKLGKRRTAEDIAIEPIHLVLIEEPEAHLHAQVQQVFIRKAYEVLRRNVRGHLNTQLFVSTHSSNIAHEVSFEKLRYFKRLPSDHNCPIPTSKVVDLSCIFGEKSKREPELAQTAKFVSRYIKTTHCDLFFANGIILVEGAAERMLLPHFIKNHFNENQSLNSSYISILEIGGAHAQRFKPLIDALGLPTLIVTDTDAIDNHAKKVRPKRNSDYKFGSDTLKTWFNLKDLSLDKLLDLPPSHTTKNNVRAVYQQGIQVNISGKTEEAIPYTFEDAIALTNISLFKELKKTTGMLKKMQSALEEKTAEKCCDLLFDALGGEKARMALDLLYTVEDPKNLEVPDYIKSGLTWLDEQLTQSSLDHIPLQAINSAEER